MFLVVSLWAKVDINSANVEELSSLKGIGEKKAQAIVDYRKVNAKFKTIDDLTQVKGIGSKIVEALKSETEVK
ncbi:ComEA family DNA-binding protein [Sulfurospirillum multivorans]|uniref:ComEA family DNA-binding protein n=1 Tax=Sulfurospirillum multivorans TaxID=66821 RepID=UPI0011DD45B4|nr:helix-hairpin-helix domain-containing protein [Sulfurospirillum multivorans]